MSNSTMADEESCLVPGGPRRCSGGSSAMGSGWLALLSVVSVLLASPGSEAQTSGDSCPPCPETAICYNSTHCICRNGFKYTWWMKIFHTSYLKCDDVDECRIKLAKCKEMHCSKKIAYYLCVCVVQRSLLKWFSDMDHAECHGNLDEDKRSWGNVWEDLRKNTSQKDFAKKATQLLQRVEMFILNKSFESPSKGEDTRLDLVYEAKRCREKTLLEAGNNTMGLNCTGIFRDSTGDKNTVALITYWSLGNFLNGSFFSDQRGKLGVGLDSRVISGTVGLKDKVSLSEPVFLTFQHTQPVGETAKRLCVYWEGSKDGGSWSTEGCFHVSSNDSHTTCQCSHLSSFAVLMALTPKLLCSIIAGVLHYLYLASFIWMLLEGLHLFLTVRNLKVANYTSAGRFKRRFMYPVGYGIPAVIVAVSAIVGHRNYGTYTHCWLRLDKQFIWSFMGPVAIIILINLVFYFQILWILRSKLSSLNKEVSTIQDTRVMTFKAIAQLFVLGCSWGLGFFMVEEVGQTVGSVIAYLFTIINVLQGVLLFVVHCLFNCQVRMEYKKWFRRVRRGVETESTEMSRSTTHTRMEEPGKSSELVH
ncbi:putative adhesion G protein-coupled receptor E4P isoform X4 [Sciurus carolinensis]|uniref:putative adhesion G protein-coupled receptor E4P isoform X4 n=1 Tax=Sciurus carolinensis TaxID=30640 RepID=UPI001FB4F8B7|nr:putative adhesion G protein-coupled receptor E4P isoform X4 [Sciurus carolinensis]